jgi:hypothetical protein
LRLTQPLFRDRVRIHGNVGVSNGGRGDGLERDQRFVDWIYGGVGMEARFSDRTQGILEFFHRDPYAAYTRWAALHGGFRYAFRESIALDGGLGLALPFASSDDRVRVFGTLGVRLTTPVRW